ncbi:MAG: fenitrothion hydrolase [Thermoleophilaceae bacterium]
MRPRTAALLGAAAGLALPALAPGVASAHGLVGRADLPIPSWLFGWAAAIVLAASFAALASLWPKPRLQHVEERRFLRLPRWIDLVCGAIGIAIFAAVVYSGFAGIQESARNLAPTAIYVIFWVGLVVLSLLFGDVFRAFNPWRSAAIAVSWLARRFGYERRVRPYPERLGRWPAVIGIVAFAWLELVYVHKADPDKLAALACAYALIQLAGMFTFGIEPWSRSADAFGVYFNLFSRLSIFERRDHVVYVRPPLSGAPMWPVIPGSAALLCVAIGSTSFDGFSNGPVWASLNPHLQSFFKDIGFGTNGALMAAGTVGLAIGITVISSFYVLGIQGMKTVGRGHDARELLGRFAHTLIPIAFAYALAHYFSLLAYQGQAVGYLVSDPLGHGSNIFGTAHATIDYGIIAGAGIWYVQVGALIAGHVSGLVLAHDRALAMYPNVKDAARSQYWMLVVMVGFTSLGLWLLSAVNT